MKILISEIKAGVKETKLRRKDGDISEVNHPSLKEGACENKLLVD